MANKKYTLDQVTQAVNHWSMSPLTSAEVGYFLKKIEEASKPPFSHDEKSKVIFVTALDIENKKEELQLWVNKDWLLQTTFKL